MLSAHAARGADLARPGDTLPPSLDRQWRSYLAGLPASSRAVAEEAPQRIGLPGPTEGTWDRFIQLEPNRALPRFAAPRHAALACFERAHHHAAFFGIVADRVADAQTARTAEMLALRRMLLRAWEGALAEGLSDRCAARRAIARDLRAWRVGLRAERDAFARRALTPAGYAATTIARLRWVSTTAAAMIEAGEGRDAAARLRRVCDLFLLACQCRDDAVDETEDRLHRGASVPELLGVPAGALLRAGHLLVRSSAEQARGHLPELHRWLSAFMKETNVCFAGQDVARCGWLAAEIASAGVEVAG